METSGVNMIRSHLLSSSTTPSSSSSPLTSQFRSGNSKLQSFSSLSFTCKFTPSFLTLTSLTKNHLSVKCARSEYLDQQRFATSEDSSYALRSPSLVPRSVVRDGASPRRVFVGHSIYKGKAALTVNPRPPEFVALESGAYKVSKDGYVLLQFAPAIGVRQYDWTRKQVFSLSVPEMGNLICLGMRESREFFHDPFKGNSDEGKVRKVLKVEPLPDGSGHFFNLNVQNKLANVDESIYIPITRAEFAVFNSLFNSLNGQSDRLMVAIRDGENKARKKERERECLTSNQRSMQYIIPYLLGWHSFANSIGPDGASRANNGNPRYGGDFEWSR